MHEQSCRRSRLAVRLSLLAFLLLACSSVGSRALLTQAQMLLDRSGADTGLEHLAVGYEAGGTLGFVLRDTPIREQLYWRASGAEREVLWTAQFVSRWPLNEGQLDRWSAQAVGLLLDELDPDVRLAGWERLDAGDLGDQHVGYRYALTTPSGERVGEATSVVFARGTQVGLIGVASIATRSPIDALRLARVLGSRPSGS